MIEPTDFSSLTAGHENMRQTLAVEAKLKQQREGVGEGDGEMLCKWQR